MKYEWSEELRGPDMIPKDKRWESEDYLKFVREMPCASCGLGDGTVVPHHLKHRYSPYSGGGTGLKASDIFVMPLCFECHTKAHGGDRDILDWQAEYIFKTLDRATKHGVISISYVPYETLIL